MDKDYVMRIAGTIREQLVSMTDTAILMSWGIQEFMATIYKDCLLYTSDAADE